jgi:hypothetical protein
MTDQRGDSPAPRARSAPSRDVPASREELSSRDVPASREELSP